MVGTRRKCSCEKDLKSKYRRHNLRNRKKKSSLVLEEEVAQRGSSNHQVSAHLLYVDLIQTIRASRFAPQVNSPILSIHSMEGIHLIADRVKNNVTHHQMASSVVCLEEDQVLIQELSPTTKRSGNQECSTKCKHKFIEFYRP